MTGLKWTRRTTDKIAAELKKMGIDVSANTVAKLLKKMGFSLRVNHKKISNGSPQQRDQQFAQIAELRERFAADGSPVISVDTKKKELVGNFKNPGVSWNREPVAVNDHDFRSLASGIAIPYGIYDLQANRGTVLRWNDLRHTPVRSRFHREVVAHRRPEALSQLASTRGPGRRRRQQRCQLPRVEARPPTSAR